MSTFTSSVLALLWPLFVFTQAEGTQPPATMTEIVVRLSGPGIKSASFAARPKTIYRAGPHYARIEDPPDPRQQIAKLTIIAEPDAYSFNLVDKKGTHAIDQGGPNDLHLPVVLPFDPKHELPTLDRLEFGEEVQFFQDANATQQTGPRINGHPTDAYELKSADGTATLVVKPGTHLPVRLTWQTKDGEYRYDYTIYREVPFDPALFAKPQGITFREIPPDNTSEKG